uniref:Uncharacterized protein n=1 Tax=Glossina pallidipes TaxID=7398 RepID=A0A1A9Z1A6_GLOPL
MIIALDRQEQDFNKQPTIKNLQKNFNFKIRSIITLTDLILFLEQQKNRVDPKIISDIKQYKKQYVWISKLVLDNLNQLLQPYSIKLFRAYEQVLILVKSTPISYDPQYTSLFL